MAFSKIRTALLAAVGTGLALSAGPASALNIVLRPDDSFSTGNGAAALFAFQKAANYWNQTLVNNVTLNFAVSFTSVGFSSPNVIGSTGSNALTLTSSAVYSALQSGSTAAGHTALDTVAVANLRPLTAAGGVNYRMPDSVTGIAGAGNGRGSKPLLVVASMTLTIHTITPIWW